MRAQLTAQEVLSRLDNIRKVLASMHEAIHGRGPGRYRFKPGSTDLLTFIAALEHHAERNLHRPGIAEYAADVGAYARFVLCELLAAASDRR